MLKLATILDNPGEPLADTQYRDPDELKRLGYNGIVLYETTGLSGVAGAGVIQDDELRHWVEQQFDRVGQTLQRTRDSGLDVLISYDVLSLARAVVEQQSKMLCCKGEPGTLCPASDSALNACRDALVALMERFGEISGIVLRFGDNAAEQLPYLVGYDIYRPHCPRCSRLDPLERITRVIDAFYQLVVVERSHTLIVRAWNAQPNGLHDNPDLCRRVIEKLPDDPRLILSFKFTETDFWRYQRWNRSSLVCADRPLIYELECQREFEAKGAIPNWQVPLWRNGPDEMPAGKSPAGLARVHKQVNLAGLWAWVRGGGWGGPFVSNETWIDANVFAVPMLADQPDADTQHLARQWITDRLKIAEGELASGMLDVLTHSPQTVLEGFYIATFAQNRADPWRPNGGWIADDLLDTHAAWRIIQQVPNAQLDSIVEEKRRAVERITGDRVELHQALGDGDAKTIEPLLNTLEYGEALLRALCELLAGLVEYRRYGDDPSPAAAERSERHLLGAQTAWNHHTQRTASLHGAATAFRETGFWELTQQILDELA